MTSVGLIDLPELAEIFSRNGITVVGGGEFRQNAMLIKNEVDAAKAAGEPIHIIALFSHQPGLTAWLTAMSQLATSVNVIGDESPEQFRKVPSGLTVNAILLGLGISEISSPDGDAIFHGDGSVPAPVHVEPEPEPVPAEDDWMSFVDPAPAPAPTPVPVEDPFESMPPASITPEPADDNPFETMQPSAPVPVQQELPDDPFATPAVMPTPAPPVQTSYVDPFETVTPPPADDPFTAPAQYQPEPAQHQAPVAYQPEPVYQPPAPAVDDPFARQVEVPAPQPEPSRFQPPAPAPPPEPSIFGTTATPEAVYQPAPAPPEPDMFSEAQAVGNGFGTTPKASPSRIFGQKTAPVIFVMSGKGGVGKTTVSITTADRAANRSYALSPEDPMKVVLIDGNIGQADVQGKLRVSSPRSIYHARAEGSLARAVTTGETLSNARANAGIREPIRFATVFGPDKDNVSQVSIDDYQRVLDAIRSQVDLVVFDTQTVEATDARGMVDYIAIPTVRSGGGWVFVVSDADREGITNNRWLVDKLIHQDGIDPNRIFLLLNRVPNDLDLALVERNFSPGINIVGIIKQQEDVILLTNTGHLVSGHPDFSAAIDKVVLMVTGDPDFEPEPISEKKTGILSSLFKKRG